MTSQTDQNKQNAMAFYDLMFNQGRPREALAPLIRVTNSCSSLEDAMIVTRARYYLGLTYESSGDKKAARDAYQRIIATWPKGTKSRTVRWTEQRLEALAK